MEPQKKIGLYFGTFNPIHVGHLIIANYMVEFSDLDEVWLVVTPHNPHKVKRTLLDDTHRLSMVRIALEDYPNLKANNVEFELNQPNYTVNTLVHLEEKHPDLSFCIIMGEDNLKVSTNGKIMKLFLRDTQSTYIQEFQKVLLIRALTIILKFIK